MSESGGHPFATAGRVTAFFRWWCRELIGIMPLRLARLTGLVREQIMLSPEDGQYSVYRLFGGAPCSLGLLSSAETIERLSHYRAAGVEIVLRIPSSQGLRRSAPIALSALPRGIDAVAGEIERQTPFAPDQVYLGYYVDKAVDSRGRVQAHLSLVPCASADEMLRDLAGCGATPDRITLGDEANENSLGDTVHIIMSRRVASAPKIWLAVTGMLGLLALASPFWRNYNALTQIENELGRVQQAALPPGSRQDGPSDARPQIKWLEEWRGQRPALTPLLNAISIALPDTAYLAQFELTGHALSLQGVARAAPELIAALEALPEVARVEFSAPTLRDPATGLEQFQLMLDLRAARAADTKP